MWPEQLDRSPALNVVLRVGIVPVILIFYATAALHFDYTPDDTYIYLQYARNIADGNGFAFNPNEPTYGVTSPLWTLLIAAGTTGGLDPYIVAKTLDLFFASLTLIVFLRVAASILQDPLFTLAATLTFSLDAWLLRWAGSGMETSLAVLLVLVTLQYIYRSEYVIASLSAALLTLVRPEGGILFLLLQADNFVNTRDWRPALRSTLKSVAVFCLIVVPWAVFAFLSFGSVIPNTFQAKSFSGYSVAGSLFVLKSEMSILLPATAACMTFLIIGVVGLMRRAPIRRVWIEAFPVAWPVALLCFYLVANVQVVSRYLLVISPVLTLFGFWGVKKSIEFWKLPWKTVLALLIGVTIVSGLQNQVLYYWKILPHLDGFTRGMSDCLRPMAYHLRGIGGKEDVVLTPDIGLVGYISGKKVYDTAGIIAPGVKKAFKGVSYDEGMMRQVYESALHPDFVIDRSVDPRRLESDNLRSLMTCTFPSMGITVETPKLYTLYERRHR